MVNLYSHAISNGIDNLTQDSFFIPALALMERAGLAATRLFIDTILKTRLGKASGATGPTIVVVAGKGNNGADALVCARELAEAGLQVFVYQAYKPKSYLCTLQDKIIRAMGLRVLEKQEFIDMLANLLETDWLFDGLNGIGLTKTIRDTELVKMINSSACSVYSLDVPSGFHDNNNAEDIVVRADHCVCFGVTKMSLYNPPLRKFAGQIHTVDIGFPSSLITATKPQAVLLQETDLDNALPPLASEAHKYSKGVSLIAAGNSETPGAAILAMQAASLGPCGLVVGLLDSELQQLVASKVPSAVTGLSLERVRKINSIVVGPGWGQNRRTLLKKLHARKDYIVMDADSLREFKLNPFSLSPYTVMTPHYGEYLALIDKTDIDQHSFISNTQELADKFSSTIVAKGSTNLICFPSHFSQCPLIVDGAVPILGTAGSGDILSGLLGSSLAYSHETMGYSPSGFVSAVWFSVLLHNYLGQCAQSMYGSANAELLIEALPHIYNYSCGMRRSSSKFQ